MEKLADKIADDVVDRILSQIAENKKEKEEKFVLVLNLKCVVDMM